jgi:acylphosphatase
MEHGPAGTSARLRAIVHGRVQGVNFRRFTAFWARELGLSGTVRNLPDGRAVEVVAEGPRPALDGLLTRLRQGPRGARVDAVDVTWQEPAGDAGEFHVIA